MEEAEKQEEKAVMEGEPERHEENAEDGADPNFSFQTYLKGFTMPSAPREKDKGKTKKANLGILLGVYLPTIQHIFGVLMFLRLFWIVGSMGIVESFFMVLICCICTFLTSISMSAIATNGIVDSGGSYFMISRNLGPAFGTAVGILFYLANAVATSMYLVGAVEILLMYLAPEITIPFGVNDTSHNRAQEISRIHLETEIDGRMTHNFRIYGLALLFIVTGIVACGVRFVQFFAPLSLIGVILSILAIFAGAIHKSTDWKEPLHYKICVLHRDGDRILMQRGVWWVNDSTPTACGDHLLSKFRKDLCSTDNCRYINSNHSCIFDTPPKCSVSLDRGFTGFKSSTFARNSKNFYMKSEESAPGVKADNDRDVFQDTKTTFFLLLAIYFPSVTGIMTGSNLSADLRDPQKAIPTGTILAQLTTSFVYLSLVILFGGTVDGILLRDKFGRSVGGKMVVAMLAWPHEYIVLIGCFTSSFGAALQCLCSAPRILQSIAKDEVLPFLGLFRKSTKCHQEPIWGLFLSSFIAALFLMVGVLDHVAPVVDFFFLMSYAVVNVVCALNSFLRVPNWRPRYRYYNKWASVLGFLLCLFIMFSTHPLYALGVWVLTAGIYAYVSWKGNKREWGDGRRGLYLSLAQYFLVKLADKDFHPKNWRPQLLLLIKSNMESEKRSRMMELAEQLKAGRGLTLVVTVLRGDASNPAKREEAKELKEELRKEMKEAQLTGFAETYLFQEENIAGYMDAMVQSAGIGGLKPNTIMVGWPESWKENAKDWKHHSEYWDFLDKIHRSAAFDNCLLVPRGVEHFPPSNQKLSGNIDIWWFIQDGGILILLGFLLTKHSTWSMCKLRIYVVSNSDDPPDPRLRKDIQNWLYHLRINAEVFVEGFEKDDVNAYSYVRTVQRNEQAKLLRELHLEKNKTLERDMLPYRMQQKNQRTTTSTSSNTPEQTVNPRTTSTSTRSLTAPSSDEEDMDATQKDEGGGMDSSTPTPEINLPTLPPLENTFDVNSEKLKGKSKSQVRSAATLNDRIRNKSRESTLVIVNLPQPPKRRDGLPQYMQYIDALTIGIPRCLLIRGCGKEVITMYS